MPKKYWIILVLFIVTGIVLLFFGDKVFEGFDDNNNNTTPPANNGGSSSAADLDVIQNFLQSRATFTNSINQLIVNLSQKNNYDDLIQHLNDIKTEINNL
jgi:hypothetical protein